GRADRKGIAITFVTENDADSLDAIQAFMNYEVSVTENPEDLLVSDVLLEFEKPKIYMKSPEIKLPKPGTVGAAFHEKLDKNKKVNVRRNYAKEKMLKYGRPIKRSGKKKRNE